MVQHSSCQASRTGLAGLSDTDAHEQACIRHEHSSKVEDGDASKPRISAEQGAAHATDTGMLPLQKQGRCRGESRTCDEHAEAGRVHLLPVHQLPYALRHLQKTLAASKTLLHLLLVAIYAL